MALKLPLVMSPKEVEPWHFSGMFQHLQLIVNCVHCVGTDSWNCVGVCFPSWYDYKPTHDPPCLWSLRSGSLFLQCVRVVPCGFCQTATPIPSMGHLEDLSQSQSAKPSWVHKGVCHPLTCICGVPEVEICSLSDPESRTSSKGEHISRLLLAPEPCGILGDDVRVSS